MNSHKFIKLALAALAIVAIVTGCSSSSDNNVTGAGGSSTGGTTATGGTTSTTGTTGTGGVASTGGTTGTGGVASTGGVSGTGGVVATGGVDGTGGAGGVSGGAGHGGGGTSGAAGSNGAAGSSGGGLTLTSADQADGAHFASKFTCQESPPLSGKTVGGLGNGINPDLEWANAPSGTMSFAITFLDTTLINAGMDSYGNHWAIWNIPASVMSFPEGTTTLSGALANAKQSGTFLAPCAQSLMNGMDDQYAFTLYALSTATLNVQNGTGVAQARTALMTAMSAGQVLGTAVLHGHAGLKGM